MKTLKPILILLLAVFPRLNAGAQTSSFYHEFSIYYSDTVSLYCNQNTFQISDSTYLSSGNYGVNFYGLAGRVIWDSSGNVVDAKYLDVDHSFYLQGLNRIDADRFLLYGQFDFYHETSGNLIDHAAAMVCFNQNGDVLWQKAYGGYAPGYPDIEEPFYDYADGFSDVQIDSVNQRIYAIGVSESFNSEHEEKPYMVCTNYDGDTIWTWVMPDIEGQKDGKFTKCIVNHEGDILLVGDLVNFNGTRVTYTRGLVMKISNTGVMQWYRLWGEYEYFLGPSSDDIIQIEANKYVIAATYFKCETCTDWVGMLLTVDNSGSIANTKYVTKGEHEVGQIFKLFKKEYGFDVLGGFVIRENDVIVLSNLFVNKYTNELELITETNYGNAGDVFDVRGISQTYDNGYLFTGYGGEQNNIVMKSDGELNLPLSEGWQNAIGIPKVSVLNCYPNPVSDLLYIESPENKPIEEIKIYDIYGHLILTKSSSGHLTVIDVSGIEHGLYILEADNVFSEKIIIN
ncbi:MAG TPA: T9SS type A sorting domain-containing protein [Bacteroidales bacterium]|nr:T9SS type A sorting domain-containing protein [Bacteroidales bacterium]